MKAQFLFWDTGTRIAALRIGRLSILLFCLVKPEILYGQNSISWEDDVSAIETFEEFRGEKIYHEACATCHGKNGNGAGPSAAAFRTPPRDLTSGIYKFRSTPSGELPLDEDLYRTVTDGIAQTTMPAWRELLSKRERLDVVAYIKTFSNDFREYGSGTPIIIPDEPEKTESSVEEGKQLYMIMDCWMCHGVKGRGDGHSSTSLVDDRGRKIIPLDFTRGQYKAGSGNRNVFNTFNTGLDGTPMPSFADAFLFSGEDISDFSPYQQEYSDREIQELEEYLASQPTTKQIQEMPETERELLGNQRKWALVHFVKSLSRESGLLYRLFVHNYETTQ